jgi:hypothetical protein
MVTRLVTQRQNYIASSLNDCCSTHQLFFYFLIYGYVVVQDSMFIHNKESTDKEEVCLDNLRMA